MAVTFEIELPSGPDQPEFARADLVFYGLDHSGPSYEVRIFVNHPKPAPPRRSPPTPVSPTGSQYSATAAASGEEGHCEVRPPVSVFDRRQPHPLVPAVRTLTVTDTIRDLIQHDAPTVTITAVPVIRPSPLATAEQATDVLVIDQVALHNYQ